MRPLKWKELKAICEAEGYAFVRQRGDHYIMTKKGARRPVVFPKKNQLKEDIVLTVAKSMGLPSALSILTFRVGHL